MPRKKADIKELNTIISNTFIEKLAPSRKFNLVDRNNLDDYAAEMSIIEGDMTLPENKVKLKILQLLIISWLVQLIILQHQPVKILLL